MGINHTPPDNQTGLAARLSDVGWELFRVFFMLLILGSLTAEVGFLFGFIPVEVLLAFWRVDGGWWFQARIPHLLNSLLLLGLTVRISTMLTVLTNSPSRGRPTASSLVLLFVSALCLAPPSPVWSLSGSRPYLLTAVLFLVWRIHDRYWPKSLEAPFRGWKKYLLIALGCILLLYLYFVQFEEMGRVISQPTDFSMFYRAAAALDSGLDPYREVDGFINPPTFAFLFKPLTWTTMAGASFLWFVLKITLILGSFFFCYDSLRGHRLPGHLKGWFILGIVLVAGRFWITDLRFGNTNIIILFLTLGAICFDLRNRPSTAGLLLALAVTIKIVPILLAAYFLANRRRNTLLWLGIGLLLFNLLPWPITGDGFLPAWTSYVQAVLLDKLSSPLEQPDNQSLWGALARTLPGNVSGIRFGWICLSLAAVVFAMVVTMRTHARNSLNQAYAASLFPLLGLMISPGSWVVHYVAVLLPMAALLRLLLTGADPHRPLLFLFIGANLVFTVSGWWRWSIKISIEASLFLIVALILFMVLGIQTARERI